MFLSKSVFRGIFFSSFIIALLLLPVQGSAFYEYSTKIEVGDTLSWEVTRFDASGWLYNYQSGLYITTDYFIPQGSTISIKFLNHPNDVLNNHPLILWNSSSEWYNLYINNSLVDLELTGSSLMTLGFLKLPYLSPIINVINTEQVAAFQFLIDHEQTFNHTSTGTLNETSEYPMDYIRTELYSSFINATDFTAESKNYLKQTQVISENFTYRREWLEISNITFDLSTGILKKQETSIMNRTTEIEVHENSVSETGHYSWVHSSLESSYPFPEPQTTETSYKFLLGIAFVTFYAILVRRKSKNRKGIHY